MIRLRQLHLAKIKTLSIYSQSQLNFTSIVINQVN